jgi:hypothetical protein
MATAQTIINDALKELGVLAENDTPSASMSNDALRALNRLMEKFSNDQSFAYYPNQYQWGLTGESSFTIGQTGQLVADRPIKIETATVDRQGVSYPVSVIDNQKWDAIAFKGTVGGLPSAIFYEGTFPNGTVHVFPLASGCTLNMRVINTVARFPSLGTELAMPPGYEEALIKNLAVNIAPQYPSGALSQLTIQAARSSLEYINRTNNVIPTMTIDPAISGRSGGSFARFMGGM